MTFGACLADEPLQDGADGLVSGCGAFADLALRERDGGVGERLEDAPFGGFGVRHRAGRGRLAQPEGGFLRVIGELDLDVVETAGGAVLDGHEGLAVAAAQVEIGVSSGVQLRAPPQRLARSGRAALAGVVDKEDGGFEAALQVSQEAEDGCDVGDGVLVDPRP